MRTGDLISCIVPVFNGERYLAEALEGLLAQTYERIEIVLVDDGSTDGTPALAATYGDRIRYVRQAHAGPGAARNRGLADARGEFIAFQDADDVSLPERMTRQMRRFDARPDLDVCLSRVQNFWILELRAEEASFADHVFTRPMPGTITGTGLLRRSLFEGIPFDTSLPTGEDLDWMARAADDGVVTELLPDVLLRRRFHFDNLTRKHRKTQADDLALLAKKNLDRKRART